MPVRNSILGSFANAGRNALAWYKSPGNAAGLAENALSALTGFGTSVVAGPVAGYHAIRSGDSAEYGPMYNAIMQRGTYEPRTGAGVSLRNALADLAGGYSEAIQRDVENIQVNMPIARTVARTVGEFAPAAVPAIRPAVTRMVSMPPTSARMRQAGIVNYHGTPHTVDRFSTDRIGTGEGAQAYGHGLYFADDAGVADTYRKTLSQWAPEIDGKPIMELYGNGLRSLLRDKAGLSNGDTVTASEMLLRSAREGRSFNDIYADEVAKMQRRAAELGFDPSDDLAMLARIKEKVSPLAPATTTGNLYTVDIPDEHIARMLDWDKPLSEQPAQVQDGVYSALIDRGISPSVANYIVLNKAGHEALATLARGEYNARLNVPDGAAAADASARLKAAGIPGIRYLDQGSRGAGQGTRNTVLFDDSLVTITHENGQPRRRPGK